MGCSSSSSATNGASAIPANKKSNGNGLPAELEQLPHTFKSRYKLKDQLGEGAFSVVKAATTKIGNMKVAVKIVDRAGLPSEDEASLKSEVEILKSLKHSNIVQCYDFFEEKGHFYVVLEYLEGGELFDRIVKKTSYNEKEARDTIFLVLNAIKYCHDRNVVHRDLKPENLLLRSKTDDADIKLADFGFAIKTRGDKYLKTQCGTPGYVAPEILEKQPYGGYPPFYDDNQAKLFKKIKKAEYEFHADYWGSISTEAKDLIKGLLTLDVDARLTIDKALGHKWLHPDLISSLTKRSLDSNLAEFKKYNAQRKFKGAAKAIMAVNKMKSLSVSIKDAAATQGNEKSDMGRDANRV